MNERTGTNCDLDEAQRLGFLARLSLLEPSGDSVLDEVARLASIVCATPAAAVVLVGATRVNVIGSSGLSLRVVPREELDARETLLHERPRTLESVEASGLRSVCPLLRQLPEWDFYSSAPVKGPEGQVLGALVVLDREARSLTEQAATGLEVLANLAFSRLESYPRSLTREALLRQEEKLAATGRMAARVAHEINNPLAGIKNAFLLLKDAIPADHKYAHYVPRVQKEIERIAGIMRQMLDLYQPDKEQDRPFPVEYTLREIVSFVEPAAQERDVRLELDIASADGQARLPDSSFRQIMYNLVQNAIDASPKGATVTIHVRVEGDVLKCRVTDQGVGISPDAKEYMFEPFFSTKVDRPGMGLGLGLPVSKGLAEGLGGSLEFESGAGAGTVFTVTLPLKRPA
ncbi:MAG: GAF domain-containing sensor histidine kinase [FCB group bacterium]|jgi:signal transduction histidine kinase|nr:GAF domain-containing sensor histidine kinase [FCB group bacterium]